MILTWLTQSGYLIEHAGARLVIDPYLSEAAVAKGVTRAVPAPLPAETLAPDWFACTHAHIDHWDPIGAPQILRLHPRCRLLAPASVRPLARAADIEENRLLPLDVGETQIVGPFRLTALPTLHSDAAGVGLLIQTATAAIYHAGDTEYTTALARDLVARLDGVPLDAALLCINGRLGNMTWPEAALLAERLRPRLAIPNHYDLFVENQQDPQPFLDRCAQLGLAARTLTAGAPFSL